jgi:hypothetical protein
MRLLLLLLACGHEAETPLETPDLGMHRRSGVLTPGDIDCCPSDTPPHGACSGGGCYGFELACSCVDGQWCCQEGGNPLIGCRALADCYQTCDQPDQYCYDQCNDSALQSSIDLLVAFEDCIQAACYQADAGDGGSACASCQPTAVLAGGACYEAWNACLQDHPTCRFT